MDDCPALRPRDVHNRTLAALVHPPDWVSPTPSGRYNLVVIGAGTAGLVAAAGAAALGARVALVERRLMGGDCLNVGCVPSKALISAARAAAAVRQAGEFGLRVPEGVRVDFPAVMVRMRRLRAAIAPADSAARFRDLGVDVFLGEGRLTGADRVQVGEATLSFKRAVIATGTRPAVPPLPGLDQIEFLTNDSLFSLTELPRRLAVLGAGPIGCEMAQTFARFGADVFLIEAEHGVLPREDRDAAALVEAALVSDGVKLLCCGRETKFCPAGDGIRVMLCSHGREYDLIVDKLLVSVGRTPNVCGLGLDAAGVKYDGRHGVTVNDRLQTSNPRIYAAGDICSQYKFTHAADFMARIVVQNALFFGRSKLSALTIPWCTYTSPELAHIGLNERDAREQGVPIDTFVQQLEDVDRAVLDGETEGFVKVHVRRGTDTIVGATIVASHAGEMIGEMSLAMTHGLGLKKIGRAIHPYPTQAEALRKLGDHYNRTRLTPIVKRLLKRWLAWTQ
jgi:pyruvate/2-oxoglutarate dehydrogenase complex dihydrolipoamide dehydrogenase (E3) component